MMLGKKDNVDNTERMFQVRLKHAISDTREWQSQTRAALKRLPSWKHVSTVFGATLY